MKTTILLLLTIVICNMSFAQIEIQDKSLKNKTVALPYNGEFMSFKDIYDQEKKAGVVGELVTLIDVSISNIYENEEDLKSRKSISYKNKKLFSNVTYEIIDYRYDYQDILKIKNDSSVFLWKVSSLDTYVFNKYIKLVREKYEGKTYVPLHNESKLEAMDGTKFDIKGSERYLITKVEFAKLQFEYGIVFKLNDSIECLFPNGSFDQPRIFNKDNYISNEKYLNVASNNIFKEKVTLIEENEFKSFASKNKTYLKKIRNRKVQIGMTLDQCRWSWGVPTRSLNNISGYNEVLIYGDVGNSQNLYFKNNILKLIN